jgi:hypothetical protein
MDQQKPKTHWRKLQNPDYLGSYDFQPGEERVVTVKSVERMLVKSAEHPKGEEETVVTFVEPFKPMIMNSTNSRMLSKLADSVYIEDWPGISFKIVVKQVKAFGDVVEALRIVSEKVVKAKPVLELGSKNFEACKAAYQKDAAYLDKIKLKYDVSAEVEQSLIAPK